MYIYVRFVWKLSLGWTIQILYYYIYNHCITFKTHILSTPSSCKFIVKSAFIGMHYRCNKDSYRQASYVSRKCLNCYGSMLRYHPEKSYRVCHNLKKLWIVTSKTTWIYALQLKKNHQKQEMNAVYPDVHDQTGNKQVYHTLKQWLEMRLWWSSIIQ